MSEYDAETEALREELEHFRTEKEKIRALIGTVGGSRTAQKTEKALTIAFTFAIVLLFCLDVMRHLLHLDVPLPPLFSIELGVLLVSVKIIWMIHMQSKVGHFQFWILNSVEFRLNDMAKQLREFQNQGTDEDRASPRSHGDAQRV